jgi:Holliday junction resolvase RusA-like endonuclease
LKEAMEPDKHFQIDVDILVMADWTWKYKNDTDNLIKPIVDLLKRADIIPDDTTRYVNSVKVRYLQGFKQPTICISYNTTE